MDWVKERYFGTKACFTFQLLFLYALLLLCLIGLFFKEAFCMKYFLNLNRIFQLQVWKYLKYLKLKKVELLQSLRHSLLVLFILWKICHFLSDQFWTSKNSMQRIPYLTSQSSKKYFLTLLGFLKLNNQLLRNNNNLAFFYS